MMRWTDVSASLCPVARTAAIIGDRWTLLILREAFFGATSFDQFETVLGVSPHLLSIRLKRLVAEGIFAKQIGGYHLTEAGHDLQPIIMLVASWGRRWRPEASGASSGVVHKQCGANFEPIVSCSECGDPVGHADVKTRFSAALIAERRATG
jgi:DNA-binding HxlR family transcriptional regulator